MGFLYWVIVLSVAYAFVKPYLGNTPQQDAADAQRAKEIRLQAEQALAGIKAQQALKGGAGSKPVLSVWGAVGAVVVATLAYYANRDNSPDRIVYFGLVPTMIVFAVAFYQLVSAGSNNNQRRLAIISCLTSVAAFLAAVSKADIDVEGKDSGNANKIASAIGAFGAALGASNFVRDTSNDE